MLHVPALLAVAASLAPAGGDPPPRTLAFRDVTRTNVVPTVPEAAGPNMKEVAVGDFDRDGDPDVAIANAAGTYGSRRNKLYRNDAGVLVEVSGTSVIPEFALTDVSRNVAFRDFDGDGWLDLLLVNDSFEFGDPMRLFMNRHPGDVFSHFVDEAPSRGLGVYVWACGAVAVDVDSDGDADVVPVNYGSQGQGRMFVNDGTGLFSDLTVLRMPPETDFSIDAAAADLNGDAKLDLLVSNDGAPFWVYYNDLLGAADQGVGDYRYGRDGRDGLQDLGTSGGHGALEPADLDGDGRVDVYWTNRDAPHGDAILRNVGNGADGRAVFAAVDPPPWVRAVPSVKSTIADLDGDGRPEVIVMTGDRPAVLRNASVPGKIAFVDWTPATTFPNGGAHAGAHAAVLDADGDGDPDLLIGGTTGDHLVHTVPAKELDEPSLPGGVLPPLLDQDPIAVRGTASRGETDVWSADDLGTHGSLSVFLRGPDDYRLEVRRDGAVQAWSDRIGAGIDEALQVELGAGSWTVAVTVRAAAEPGAAPYVLELLARRDGPENDDCADALPITVGTTAFTNVGATTDGPPRPTCTKFGDDQVQADVWYDWVAPCTGTLTVSTCGTADYDTKLALYDGVDCPVDDADFLACAEDTEGCPGYTSILTAPVECGRAYKLRVGGWMGATGSGTLEVTCEPAPLGTSYCTSLPNSTGSAATLSLSGSTSVAANDLVLAAGPVAPFQNGLVVYSPDAASTPLGNGVLCVGSSTLGFVLRLPFETSDASGTLTHALDVTRPPHPAGQILPGATWRFQAWFRDVPGGGAGFNFSDGVAVLFCP